MAAEEQPLLASNGENYGSSEDISLLDGNSRSKRDTQKDQASVELEVDLVRLKRHITLPYAVVIIVGSVIGSGIFVSPKGVTNNVGSVGASLIIWALTGVYNLGQALCYAELGSVIPKAGGDYAYIYYILGALPAFMSMWIHIVVLASSSCAVIARTAGLYVIQPLGLGCHTDIITIIAIWIIVTLAAVNARSSIWGMRAHGIFMVAKVLALVIIIIAGFVKLGQGYTSNFHAPFEGTSKDPGSIALSVLDGYFAYKGWELINALPEEMVNPKRDLNIAVWIGMLLVTCIYVLTNVAYFTVLTPEELVQSDAVALTFADRALGPVAVIIPIAVALSCMGAVNGDFLGNSRYLFAGGRFKQVPQVFGFINTRRLTPLMAIMLLCVIAVVYCVFTDLQMLQEYASLAAQLKMLITLIALFYFRWKRPDIERPVKVNLVLAVVVTTIMVLLIVLSFYKSPVPTGIGVGIFALGIPLYFLGLLCHRSRAANGCMDAVTRVTQKIFLVVPESRDPHEEVKDR